MYPYLIHGSCMGPRARLPLKGISIGSTNFAGPFYPSYRILCFSIFSSIDQIDPLKVGILPIQHMVYWPHINMMSPHPKLTDRDTGHATCNRPSAHLALLLAMRLIIVYEERYLLSEERNETYVGRASDRQSTAALQQRTIFMDDVTRDRRTDAYTTPLLYTAIVIT